MSLIICSKLNEDYPNNTSKPLVKPISFMIDIISNDESPDISKIKHLILGSCRLLASCVYAYNVKIKITELSPGNQIFSFRQTLTKWPNRIDFPADQFEFYFQSDLRNEIKEKYKVSDELKQKMLKVQIELHKEKLKRFIKIHPDLTNSHYIVFRDYTRPELQKVKTKIKTIDWGEQYLIEIKIRDTKTKIMVLGKLVKLANKFIKLERKNKDDDKIECPLHIDCFKISPTTSLVYLNEALVLEKTLGWTDICYHVEHNRRYYHTINTEPKEYHELLSAKQRYVCTTRNTYRSKQSRQFKNRRNSNQRNFNAINQSNTEIENNTTELTTLITKSFKEKLKLVNEILILNKVKPAKTLIMNLKLKKIITNIISYSLDFIRDNISLVCVVSHLGFIGFRRNVIPKIIETL